MSLHGAMVDFFLIEFGDLLRKETAVAEPHMSPLIGGALADTPCGVSKRADDCSRCSGHEMIWMVRVKTIVREFSLKLSIFLDQGHSASRLGQKRDSDALKWPEFAFFSVGTTLGLRETRITFLWKC